MRVVRIAVGSMQLRDRARALRRDCTVAEALLWRRLRNGGLGARFRRQRPIGSYIVDFYCPDRGLVVELDGAQHLLPDEAAYDEDRTAYLTGRRLTVVRFANHKVLRDLGAVLAEISDAIGPSP